ncbi:TetR/AcrR family transcriptional regulator [Streptosporangium sp. 'caverna']|uniref:TetR/AcrR family transcriptional regulator n=1 Tax=Streptosporangium sp. 'caverna' TaxID=2202249 RepID=UPI000D7DA4B8|nr:TetR/AcrR family transcriptional regulator [Streptosporangium sp. 'caverna']AWS40963.1 TetR family transcriptional regulator [Streptosporangium sp. 'caverna']
MGNREDLLAGAKRCLYEKGYVRTTARDIATASGVSLAAIGYHYRSKDALMNAALYQALQEWGDEIERAFTTEGVAGATPAERFAATWDRVIESFITHRPLWVTQFEIIAQIDHLPEVRELLAAGVDAARVGLAELFQNILATGEGKEEERAAVGAFYQMMLTGVLGQWLIAPDRAPSGRDLTVALRAVAANIGSADEADQTGPAGEGRA